MLKLFVNLLYLFYLSVQVTFLYGNLQTIAPLFYIPMHDVVPRVVAIAVSIVITKCRIFWMISFFIVVWVLELWMICLGSPLERGVLC